MKRKFYNQQFHTGLPVVNLLSPGVFKAMAARRLANRFVVAAVVLALLIGVGWAGERMRAAEAAKLLVVEQAETARVTSEAAELAPVSTFIDEVAAQKTLVQKTMANEAYLARVLDGLHRATPTGVRIETVAALVDAPEGTPAAGANATPVKGTCPAPDPFAATVSVGCVTLSGSATTRGAVGLFVTQLARTGIFIAPYISATSTSTSAEAGTSVTFSGSVALTKAVYSKRYADLTKLLPAGGR